MALKKNLSLLLKKRQKIGLEVVQFHGVCLLLAITSSLFTVYELLYLSHWLTALVLFALCLSFLLLAWQIKKSEHLRKGRTRLLILSLLSICVFWYWAATQQVNLNLYYALALGGNLLVSSRRSILRNLILFIFTLVAFRLIWWVLTGQHLAGSNMAFEMSLGMLFSLALFAMLFITRFRIQQQKSEVKQLQGNLVTQKQMLHNTGNRLLGLSKSVAHNLRSPLVGLKMLNTMYPKVGEKEREDISRQSEEAIQDLKSMVEELSEIIGDYQQLKEPFQRLNLEMELKHVLEELKPLISNRGVKLSYDFARLKRISFPQHFLRYIIKELITNAIKHSDEGKPLTIEVTSRRNHSGGLIRVSDNGPGINLNEDGEQILKLYGKLNTKSPENRGLGLYRVKSQVELSGGQFFIKSKVGEGTTVEIVLP